MAVWFILLSLAGVQLSYASDVWVKDLITLEALKLADCNLNVYSPPHPGLGDFYNLTVHFIDVRQGDSLLVQCKGKNLLIDGGTKEMGLRVSQYLKSQGIKNIDLLVATHPHSDHIGGLLNILKEFRVRMVLDSGQVYTSATYENFLKLIDQKDIPYMVAERGRVLNLAQGLTIEVLSPPGGRSLGSVNDNSVVLEITYGRVKLLLVGDASFTAENDMLMSGYNLDADLLKVGHHGSKYATSSAFLGVVTPSESIISVSANNSYGHPAPETLLRLIESDSRIYRTDLQGDIIFTTDGVGTYTFTKGPQIDFNSVPTSSAASGARSTAQEAIA